MTKRTGQVHNCMERSVVLESLGAIQWIFIETFTEQFDQAVSRIQTYASR